MIIIEMQTETGHTDRILITTGLDIVKNTEMRETYSVGDVVNFDTCAMNVIVQLINNRNILNGWMPTGQGHQ